jgi:hypothetical protein
MTLAWLTDYNVTKLNVIFYTRNAASNANHESKSNLWNADFFCVATAAAEVAPIRPAGRVLGCVLRRLDTPKLSRPLV